MTLASQLRATLAAAATGGPILLQGDPRDADLAPGETFVSAAVLVPIVDRPDPGLLLTLRPTTMRKHAGQVAFPGGRADPEDADLFETALREAEEEIGLPRELVDIVGTVDRYRTITGYEVTPVVGVIPPDLIFMPQPAEVEDVFEVPLAFVLEAANHIEHSVEWQGHERHFYEMIWEGRRIWGATAGMIVNLGRRMAYGA